MPAKKLRRYIVDIDGIEYAIDGPENATLNDLRPSLEAIINSPTHIEAVKKLKLKGQLMLRSALETGAKELAASDNMSALGGAYFDQSGRFVLPELGKKSLTQIVEESRARAAQDALNTWQTYAINPIQPALEALGYAKPDLRWKDPSFMKEREKAAARMEELFARPAAANSFEGNLLELGVPHFRRAREEMVASGNLREAFTAGLGGGVANLTLPLSTILAAIIGGFVLVCSIKKSMRNY